MGFNIPNSVGGKPPGHHWYNSFNISHHLHGKPHAWMVKSRNNLCCLLIYFPPLYPLIETVFSQIWCWWIPCDRQVYTSKYALCKEYSLQQMRIGKNRKQIDMQVLLRKTVPSISTFFNLFFNFLGENTSLWWYWLKSMIHILLKSRTKEQDKTLGLKWMNFNCIWVV